MCGAPCSVAAGREGGCLGWLRALTEKAQTQWIPSMAHGAVHRPLRPRASHIRMLMSLRERSGHSRKQIRSPWSQSLWSTGKKSSSGHKTSMKHREGCTGEQVKAEASCVRRPCLWLGTAPLPALHLPAPRAREQRSSPSELSLWPVGVPALIAW